MKTTIALLLITMVWFNAGCLSVTTHSVEQADELQAAALKPYGRTQLNEAKELELVSSAAHVGFSFEGRECQVYASIPQSGGHNYLQYELDDTYHNRVRINSNTAAPITITAPAAGRHTVWLYKATEAHTGPIFIRKISGRNLEMLTKPAAPLIEFIGNSITCGAAADPSEVACGTGEYHDQHNAYAAYGPRVARALEVDFVMSCVSGIGMYRNWNSDGPIMPQVYERVDFQENSARSWGFTTFQPQVVSIALGTNDFSQGDGIKERLPFDSTRFVSNYIAFVGLVKSKYPAAQIALLSSPMVTGTNQQLLENCLRAVKSRIEALYPADKSVALHLFKPMQASGCTGHPSVEEHEVLAAELIPFFRELLQP